MTLVPVTNYSMFLIFSKNMQLTIILLALTNLILLSSCSSETLVTEEFQLPAGASINIRTDLQPKYRDSGLYFSLREIPAIKKDRDFTDFISLQLIDEKGVAYRPENIWDINGSKKDIVASFSSLPKGAHIKNIKITALQDLEGSKIRWWTGKLK